VSVLLTQNQLAAATTNLVELDPRFKIWVERIPAVKLRKPASYFSVLLHSIVAQQISAKAAQTVQTRLFGLCANPRFPKAEEYMEYFRQPDGENIVQSCGLSGQKLKYVKSLSEAFAVGSLQKFSFASASDSRILETLTAIKGIGLWTAEMFLIFGLRRPDVFSSGDLALRNGLMRVVGKTGLKPAECSKIAEAWSPYRTVASLYLWKVAHWEE
jgi:DNA-3-methyladenine glycosylase II